MTHRQRPGVDVDAPRVAVEVDAQHAEALRRVVEVLGCLRHGEVTLVVHQGEVVQVNSLEKYRLPSREA